MPITLSVLDIGREERNPTRGTVQASDEEPIPPRRHPARSRGSVWVGGIHRDQNTRIASLGLDRDFLNCGVDFRNSGNEFQNPGSDFQRPGSDVQRPGRISRMPGLVAEIPPATSCDRAALSRYRGASPASGEESASVATACARRILMSPFARQCLPNSGTHAIKRGHERPVPSARLPLSRRNKLVPECSRSMFGRNQSSTRQDEISAGVNRLLSSAFTAEKSAVDHARVASKKIAGATAGTLDASYRRGRRIAGQCADSRIHPREAHSTRR